MAHGQISDGSWIPRTHWMIGFRRPSRFIRATYSSFTEMLSGQPGTFGSRRSVQHWVELLLQCV